MTHPRDSIINSYYKTIDNSFQENRSQIKLINFGTGSGKTYMLFQSMYETIKKYPTIQIIGVYVAPLREHLKIPIKLENQYQKIPVYTMNSLEMKTKDEYLDSYKKWIPSILKDQNIWRIAQKKYPSEKLDENRKNLGKAQNIIKQIEFIKKMDIGDEEFKQDQFKRAILDLNSLIEKFLEFLIKCQLDERIWSDECKRLVEIFYPLHLLREKSGILMLTCDKFETAVPYFKFNGETWVKKNLHLHEYVALHTDNSTKFIIAFDEQEDSYQKMLEKMIDIIHPQTLAINNALSSVNREFSIIFAAKSDENRKLLKFLEKNPDAFNEFEEYLEKNQSIDKNWIEFAKIYQRLTSAEGNSQNFLKKMVKINRSLEQSLEEIADIFEHYKEEKPITFDFEILYKILSNFENNRTFLIQCDIYDKIGDDLMNIFSFNNLYIYNLDPLKKLFLTRHSSGHVCVTENKTSNSTSLAELVYVIFAVRLQINMIKDFLNNVLNAEDSQSRSLEIWSSQVAKIQKASKSDLTKKSNYLDRSYVYNSYKSIINIAEISRYQNSDNNLIFHDLKEISIGSTTILTSPENTINTMVRNNEGSNVIFFISATGGIFGDLSTSFDMSYLEDSLRDGSGQSSFKTMTEQELELCEEIRNYRQSTRQVTVDFFNGELESYPNVKTQTVVERFEKLVLKEFINSQINDRGWFSLYKIQELKGFIHFLFYLFEDDSIQEIFAFTQTLQWIKKLIQYCELKKSRDYPFKQSSEHPDIYYVQVNHNKYNSNLRIKLILYDAQFNQRYVDKTVKKTYLNELHEEDGQKIFFISAYRSASKGFNPTVRTRNDEEKDFDSLVLLMDPYYTKIKPSTKNLREKGKNETNYHFALMKNLVKMGDAYIQIKDFNKYLKQPEAIEFRENQHQILLGKEILQAIGRTERRDFPGQIVKIFLNEETRKNLVSFYKYLDNEEPDEVRKLSINNHEVYLRVKEEEKKHIISDYDEHVYDEKEAALAFHQFRQKMLAEIDKFHHHQNSFEITKAWDALRDPLAFKNPETYLIKLKKTKLFPDEFVESLFYETKEQPFTPYLASEKEESETFWIISDSINGKQRYSYYKRLYPEYLKTFEVEYDSEEGGGIPPLNPSTERIWKLYRNIIPQPEIFKNYIPRPHFFYDVLYPSLTEHFVERWIKEVIFLGKDWKMIQSHYGIEQIVDFNKYNKLYEKFDLFYLKGNELFGIDVKAWSKISGNRLSKETVTKTQDKLDAIISEYSEFGKVKGLLLNLHATKEKNQQHSQNLFSGNLIYFDNQHLPVESRILRNFLFSKEKI